MAAPDPWRGRQEGINDPEQCVASLARHRPHSVPVTNASTALSLPTISIGVV